MSSKFIFLGGLLYLGATWGYVRHAQWPEAIAWCAYSIANMAFAYRAFTQGN